MLTQLRKKKNAKKIWIFLAVIIILAFVFGSVRGVDRNREKDKAFAGVIEGKKISFEDYRDSMLSVKNAAIMQLGDKFNEMSKYLNLEEQAWDRLVLLSQAKSMRLRASDKEVIELIEQYPFFQRNGMFNEGLYNETLRYVFRVQPRIFEEQTRQNIIISKLYKQTVDNTPIDEALVKEEYRKLNEEISVYYLSALLADYTAGIKVSEQELSDYFNKNALQFKQPLSFNLEYITTDKEDKINIAQEKLSKKEDLNKIASATGISVKETGLFGQTDPVPGLGWSAELLNALTNAKPGDYLAPVRNEKSFYIFKVKERKEPYIPELAQISSKVKEVLVKERAQKQARDAAQKGLDTALQNKKFDFARIAKMAGLKSGVTAGFKFGSYIEGLGSSDIFWSTAKALKDDAISSVISTPEGFYLIRIKSIKPIDEAKFAKEHDDFKNKLLSQKRQEAFSKYLEGLRKNSKLNL
ncbi:MAG: peptidyl-prolyl cis-trans isomerase [Candidatus Omnitrophica bacterium]|nr:peptidyl-prolyl cis-trans isomerase [Candidatus Omnitrophota bacterium]